MLLKGIISYREVCFSCNLKRPTSNMVIPRYRGKFINFPNEIYYWYKHKTEVVKLERKKKLNKDRLT